MKPNILTVDVEDWYMTSDFSFPHETWGRFEDRVVHSTMRLLKLFDKYQARGTFFVLGCVAERHPELIKEIAARGHEIGSHGYWHRLLHTLSPEEFRSDIRSSKQLLEELSGTTVTAFRAPSWSVTPDDYGKLRILAEEGYTVDSSMQPFRTPLSGIKGAPVFPFIPVLDGEKLPILEFPPTVLKLPGLTVPFSGGLYMRVMPEPVVGWLLERVNRERTGMIYVHPWEIDPGQPVLRTGPLVRFAHYYRLKHTYGKLDKLLWRSDFVPLGEALRHQEQPFPCVDLGVSKEWVPCVSNAGLPG